MAGVGEKMVKKIVITESAIREFSEISGDRNPLHLDEKYAKRTMFGQRIAHGMLIASYFSAVIANELPGPGAIYLSQELKFLKPIHIGEEIEIRVAVSEIQERGRIVLETTCINNLGELAVQGSAVVKLMGGL